MNPMGRTIENHVSCSFNVSVSEKKIHHPKNLHKTSTPQMAPARFQSPLWPWPTKAVVATRWQQGQLVVSWDMAGLDGAMVSIWHHVFLSASLQKTAEQNNKGSTTTNYSSYCCCYWYYKKQRAYYETWCFLRPFFWLWKKVWRCAREPEVFVDRGGRENYVQLHRISVDSWHTYGLIHLRTVNIHVYNKYICATVCAEVYIYIYSNKKMCIYPI